MSLASPHARRSSLRVLASVLGFGGGALFVAACSLGEGITPTCDPTAPPGDPTACDLRVACDDGRGGVAASEACCVDAVKVLVDRCTQTVTTTDWRTACEPDGALASQTCTFVDQDIQDKTPNVGVSQGSSACAMAQDAFDHCLAGGFTYVSPAGAGGGQGTGGGTSTGGGMGGRGGAGGN